MVAIASDFALVRGFLSRKYAKIHMHIKGKGTGTPKLSGSSKSFTAIYGINDYEILQVFNRLSSHYRGSIVWVKLRCWYTADWSIDEQILEMNHKVKNGIMSVRTETRRSI